MGGMRVKRSMGELWWKLCWSGWVWNGGGRGLEGKRKEGVERKKEMEELLVWMEKGLDVVVEKRRELEGKDVKEGLEGRVKRERRVVWLVEEDMSEVRRDEGMDMWKRSVWS